jgi:prophage antirepressor-like protein
MTELVNAIDKTLHFTEKNIRVLGTNDDTWYIAKDICVVLGFKNVTEALRHVPENQRGVTLVNPNTSQNCIKITEQAMYKLIMRSNKPTAQNFQDYVCGEILTSIRKTGLYKLEEIALNIGDSKVEQATEKQEPDKIRQDLEAKEKQFIEESNKLRQDLETKEKENKQLVEESNKLRQLIKAKQKKIKQLIEDCKNIKESFEAKEKILIEESNKLTLQLEEITKENDVKNNQSQDSCLNTKEEKLVKASDGLFNCALKLANGSSITIPMREDGYINATMLCKAHGKKLLADYNRNKQTKKYLDELSIIMGIPILELFVTTVGGNHNGTWVHRKVAIHLAQWLSPNFAVQVSNWVDELLITGKVELGNEKSSEELDNKFQERIIELTQEKEILKQVLENKDQDIKTLQTDLLQEQKDVISAKKSLMKTQTKFSQRHKFTDASCVYILQDPDCKYNKLKIGLTTDINQRLTSDRTMIPNIKVRYIMYNDHCELFEKAIKVRCKENLELPSHEWVFESLDNLIKIYNEIDKSNGFSSIIETDLWRYNLEPPPSEKYQEPDPVNIPTYYGTPISKISNFLSGPQLIRGEYLIKNNNAPQGQRWCNGWCQCYKMVTDFAKRSASPMTICIYCENMLDVAIIKVNSGLMTEKEIRKDPSKILLEPNQQICRKCETIKHTNDFDEKKRQCKQCRNKVRNKFKENFNDIVESEVKTLRSLGKYERDKRLDNNYNRDQLFMISSVCKTGRKESDSKKTILDNLVKYFDTKDLA